MGKRPGPVPRDLGRSGCDTKVSREPCCSFVRGVTTPAVLQAVSYRGVRPRQWGVRSPRDNVSSSLGMATEAPAEVATAGTEAVGGQGRVVRSTRVNRRKR